MLHAVIFYLFAAVISASAFLVIAARNPVHSVLFLILAFFTASGLFILIGAEFLGMILLIVYVGAVSVLFLFVVMMLDIDVARLRQGFLQFLPIGAVVGLILFIELVLVLGSWAAAPLAEGARALPTPPLEAVSNTEALGLVLYTRYVHLFQVAGMILLVAMVGAIVLTLRSREGVRRQTIVQQVGRRREETIEIRKVSPGQGI